MKKAARDLEVGDLFPSPREEEGLVRVVCSYGRCTHDERPDSVHVRGGNEWFIALYDKEILHVCDEGEVFCWEKNPTVEVPYHGELPHRSANTHAQ